MPDRLGQLVADQEARACPRGSRRSARACAADAARTEFSKVSIYSQNLASARSIHIFVIACAPGARNHVTQPPQDPQHLPGSRPARPATGSKPSPALLVPSRLLLLRSALISVASTSIVNRYQRGVPPRPLARSHVRRTPRHPFHAHQRDILNPYPEERSRVQHDRPEQHLLVTRPRPSRYALAAVCQRHHESRVGRSGLYAPEHHYFRRPSRSDKRSGRPDLVGDLRHQRRAGMRCQAGSVRRDFYGYRASIAHHLRGRPPSSGISASAAPRIPAQSDRTPPSGADLLHGLGYAEGEHRYIPEPVGSEAGSPAPTGLAWSRPMSLGVQSTPRA